MIKRLNMTTENWMYCLTGFAIAILLIFAIREISDYQMKKEILKSEYYKKSIKND